MYGWKLHLAITVSGMWIPLSARLTPANTADNHIAPALIEELPDQARFVLGDTHYGAENVAEKCQHTKRFLVTSKRGAYPHTDAGVEVRRIFHKLRSLANENFNEHFKAIFDVHGQVPTKGRVAPSGSLLERYSSTSWPCCIVTSRSWRSTVDSNHSSEPPDEL